MRATPRFIVEATGRYTYREEVPARVYRTIQSGDTLQVTLTPVFSEWNAVEVVRNGRVVSASRGLLLTELFEMATMGLFFLVGLGVFLPKRRLFPERLFSAHVRMGVLVVALPVLVMNTP